MRLKNAFELRPPDAMAQRLSEKVRTTQDAIERTVIPTKRELEMYSAFWQQLNANPTVDEEKINRRVARRYSAKPAKVNAVNIKVGVYKEWTGKFVKEKVTEKLKLAHGTPRSVVYEPTQELIDIQLLAGTGITESHMKRLVKEDLLWGVHVGFSAWPSIQTVGVYVFADTLGGDVVKVASVKVTRQSYNRHGPDFFKGRKPERADQLGPWYGPAMR